MADELFGLSGKVAVVTGGGGVLCGCLAEALGARGVSVAVLDLREDAAESVAKKIRDAGGKAIGVKTDVLDPDSVKLARERVLSEYGKVDFLINGAGGNSKRATTGPDAPFFGLALDGFRWVFDLNFIGTLVPSQVFGEAMAESGEGVILNVSSMNAFRPLTKIPAYSAAKAAVSNFTQWLAVHISQNHSKKIRVNAIAPGFFLTDQNRFLLVDEKSGNPTPRGQTIIDHTPMARYGDPEDLIGTVVWLLSDAGRFVHGVVVPIDGGFSAFSGV